MHGDRLYLGSKRPWRPAPSTCGKFHGNGSRSIDQHTFTRNRSGVVCTTVKASQLTELLVEWYQCKTKGEHDDHRSKELGNNTAMVSLLVLLAHGYFTSGGVSNV